MIVITPQPYDSYSQQVTIDNVRYGIRLAWNNREAVWIMDVTDENDNPIVMGITLRCGLSLFAPYPDLGLPVSGDMMAIDNLSLGTPIGHDDLMSGRISLVYA